MRLTIYGLIKQQNNPIFKIQSTRNHVELKLMVHDKIIHLDNAFQVM